MCLKQGNAVLFEVNSALNQYPVYLKDSILNTNPTFDYGPFLSLAKTVSQGTAVQAFSYVFEQVGIYVFVDSTDAGKLTVIGVVSESQECSNQGSGNVQMVTQQALA